MSVHRRELILPRNQQFFRIAHAATALQIGQAPVAQGKQKQAQSLKITGAIIGNIPAALRINDRPRCGGVAFERLRRPIGKRRQSEAKAADHIIRLHHDVVDLRAFHTISD